MTTFSTLLTRLDAALAAGDAAAHLAALDDIAWFTFWLWTDLEGHKRLTGWSRLVSLWAFKKIGE